MDEDEGCWTFQGVCGTTSEVVQSYATPPHSYLTPPALPCKEPLS
jgi:hypothetical protein